MWNDWIGIIVAIAITTFLIILAGPSIERFYGLLAVPVCSATRLPDSDIDMPVVRGVLYLAAAYLASGALFAISGGTAGYFINSGGESAIPLMPIDGIQWGFVIGVLLAVLARVRAASASNALIDQLASLAIVTASVLVFTFVVASGSRQGFAKCIESARQSLNAAPLFGILTVLSTSLMVEVSLYLREKFGSHDTKEITRFGLRQRIEQHEMVEQVFWPRHVERETNRVIRDAILRDGVRNICWMTNTAPSSHLDEIQSAATKWAQNKYSGSDSQKIVSLMLKANMRVIVPQETGLGTILEGMAQIRRYRETKDIFRTRLLIINGDVAVIHLPIPFHKRANEQSNFAAIARGGDTVREMQAMFDDIWEEMHHQEIQRKACKMMTDGNDLGCLSWLIVCEHLHGIRLVDIVSNVNRRTSLLQDSAHVEKILDRLQKDRLISKVRYGQEDWYYPKRRHGVGRTLDSLTRMVLRGMT